MEYMKETFKDSQVRIFENDTWTCRRTFFENGIVDDGYFDLQFDFSNCELENHHTKLQPMITTLLIQDQIEQEKLDELEKEFEIQFNEEVIEIVEE